MAYHAATATAIMFGGGGNGCFEADTWGWNGVTWNRKA